MARKSRDGGRQSHPSGPLETVDDDLKRDIRAAMDAKGLDQKDLAEQIPVSPASITNMFKPGSRQIRFKARMFEVLGIAGVGTDELLRQIHRDWPHLSPAKAEIAAKMIRELAKRE